MTQELNVSRPGPSPEGPTSNRCRRQRLTQNSLMTLIPRSIIGRVTAILFLLACGGMLAFAWVQQDIHDMPEAFIWLMVFLTFPNGYTGAVVISLVPMLLSGIAQLPYHPFWDIVPPWVGFTIAGYFQWFMLIPWLWRKFVAKSRHPATRSSGL